MLSFILVKYFVLIVILLNYNFSVTNLLIVMVRCLLLLTWSNSWPENKTSLGHYLFLRSTLRVVLKVGPSQVRVDPNVKESHLRCIPTGMEWCGATISPSSWSWVPAYQRPANTSTGHECPKYQYRYLRVNTPPNALNNNKTYRYNRNRYRVPVPSTGT